VVVPCRWRAEIGPLPRTKRSGWKEDGNPGFQVVWPVAAFFLLALAPATLPQQTPGLRVKSFSVGADQPLHYPNSRVPGLPDEHTSFKLWNCAR
jgi:hypothetical protein